MENDSNNNLRILIFETEESLKFLGNPDDWFMDGTFSAAPPQFAHDTRFISRSSLHWMLRPSSEQSERETYVEMLQQISQLTNGFVPQCIMIGDEQSCSAQSQMCIQTHW